MFRKQFEDVLADFGALAKLDLALDGLSAETLAERVLALARLAGGVSGRLAAAEAVSSPAAPVRAGSGADFLSV